MSHYRHLSICERESIWEMQIKGESLRKIAKETGRNVSTISRELKRNKGRSYSPAKAQEKYKARRKKSRRHQILEDIVLQEKVLRLIKAEQWSPEQISKRLQCEGSGSISYNTIYRALKNGFMEGLGKKKTRHGKYPLQNCLRRKAQKGKSKKNTAKGYISAGIDERPKEADERMEIGHWEGDTLHTGYHKSYVITMVDRKSKYLLTMHSNSQKPGEISEQIVKMFEGLPSEKLKTVTVDRGIEFSYHAQITEKIEGLTFYFAHAMCPWERGLNENTNGLLRQYIPKRSYKTDFSEKLLEEFTNKLNLRPRKSLGWKSPFEVFFHTVLHLT